MEPKDYTGINILITDFLVGEASKDDIQKLEAWIGESGENHAYFREMKNIWEVSEKLPISGEKALEKVMKILNRGDNKLYFLIYAQRVAAILFIPLLISMLWLVFEKNSNNVQESVIMQKTTAAFGSYSYLVLSDGSKVWLNAGSSLQYPDRFTSSVRNVVLNGEAYFEIHSDSAAPFLVTTSSFTVKATGTRFNVMAYGNSRNPTVTLVEGKVAVQKVNSGEKNNLISLLSPNQHLIYDTLNGDVSIQTEDIYKHISWKDGRLVFRNDLISEVAKKISVQYNVDIEIVGDKIKRYRFRATFENEPLSEVLRLLKISSPIDYREVQSELLPDGTFSRRRITIFSTEKN